LRGWSRGGWSVRDEAGRRGRAVGSEEPRGVGRGSAAPLPADHVYGARFGTLNARQVEGRARARLEGSSRSRAPQG
jgi:hypothetical protein